jgi:hypothetical protein
VLRQVPNVLQILLQLPGPGSVMAAALAFKAASRSALWCGSSYTVSRSMRNADPGEELTVEGVLATDITVVGMDGRVSEVLQHLEEFDVEVHGPSGRGPSGYVLLQLPNLRSEHPLHITLLEEQVFKRPPEHGDRAAARAHGLGLVGLVDSKGLPVRPLVDERREEVVALDTQHHKEKGSNALPEPSPHPLWVPESFVIERGCPAFLIRTLLGPPHWGQ